MNPFLVSLKPVAVQQGRRLLGDAPVPAPPTGNPFGVVGGSDGARQLLVVGDEFAAGWGLHTQDQTLAATLAQRLAAGRPVVWQAVTEPGCTIRQVQQQLSGRLPQHAEAVILWVGWSDVVGGTTTGDWRQALDATVRLLSRMGPLVVVGCPPVGEMPQLHKPLSWVLAARAKDFDQQTARVCAERGAAFVPLTRRGKENAASLDFQDDGLHLGPTGHAMVARCVASALA